MRECWGVYVCACLKCVCKYMCVCNVVKNSVKYWSIHKGAYFRFLSPFILKHSDVPGKHNLREKIFWKQLCSTHYHRLNETVTSRILHEFCRIKGHDGVKGCDKAGFLDIRSKWIQYNMLRYNFNHGMKFTSNTVGWYDIIVKYSPSKIVEIAINILLIVHRDNPLFSDLRFAWNFVHYGYEKSCKLQRCTT